MIKRSPAISNPNGRNAKWFPSSIKNVSQMIMLMAGFNPATGLFPETESYDIDLEFDLQPGQTITNSIPSRAGTWILLEKRATTIGTPSTLIVPSYPDMVKVSCYIVSEGTNTNIILTEEQPLSLVFGTGEWQLALLPETWNSVNNRIFSVKNTTPDRVVVNLGFKLIRVAPAVIN